MGASASKIVSPSPVSAPAPGRIQGTSGGHPAHGHDGTAPAERLIGEAARPLDLVRWGDTVVGQSEAKRALEARFFMPRRFPGFFRNAAGSSPRAVLLWGPPGTGKTLLAMAIAKHHDAAFESISPASLLSKWHGETDQNIKRMFDKAKTTKTVLFLDELDGLALARSDNDPSYVRTQMAQMLQSMDDFIKNATADSVLLACTNFPNSLDTAMRRRFTMLLFVGLPDQSDRVDLLRFYLAQHTNNVTEDERQEIAACCSLFSGSDMARLVDMAKDGPVRELYDATHFQQVPHSAQPARMLWKPSAHDVAGAVRVTLAELQRVHGEDCLAPKRDITVSDLRWALGSCQPTITQRQYDEYLQQRKKEADDATHTVDGPTQLTALREESLNDYDKELISVFSPYIEDPQTRALARLPPLAHQFHVLKRFMVATSGLAQTPGRLAARYQTFRFGCIVHVWMMWAFAPTLLWLLVAACGLLHVGSSIILPVAELVQQYMSNSGVDTAQQGDAQATAQVMFQAASLLVLVMVAAISGYAPALTGQWLLDVVVTSFVIMLVTEIVAQAVGAMVFAHMARTKALLGLLDSKFQAAVPEPHADRG